MSNSILNLVWGKIKKLLPYIILIIMLGVSMIPLLSMVGSAFRSQETFMTTRSVFPKEWSLFYFKTVLSDKRIINYFKNSFIISGFVCLIATAFAVIGGYSLSRYRGKVKGIKLYNTLLLMLQMFPIIQVIIPLYMTFQGFGVINKPYTLIFAHPAFILPMSLWMMQSFIDGIPYEIEEAGRIDGCNRIQVLVNIVMPVCKPGIATTAILAFNQSWNEFLMAMILVKKDSYRTLPLGLQNYMQENVSDWGSILAASTLMIIPVLLFLNVLQKYIVSGLTMGAVKG